MTSSLHYYNVNFGTLQNHEKQKSSQHIFISNIFPDTFRVKEVLCNTNHKIQKLIPDRICNPTLFFFGGMQN